MTHDRLNSRAVHIFWVEDPCYGSNGWRSPPFPSAPCHYGWGFSAWRMLGSGKAWHPFCRFFLVLECLFWLAYVLSHQLFNQHVFSKCQTLFGLDLSFGSANHPSFWNLPRHQRLGPYPRFCLLQRHWNFLFQCHLPRFFSHSSDGFCFVVSEWTLFGVIWA